ncbi:MAG TPA: hypothetical protein VGD88_03580 [Opitutaceae bacterium]
MANLLIKNLTSALYRRLKQLAHGRHRSVQQEALLALERGLGPVRSNFAVPEPVIPIRPLDDVLLAAARNRNR